MLSIIHIRLGVNHQTESEPSRDLWEKQFKSFSLSGCKGKVLVREKRERQGGGEGQRREEIRRFKVAFP